jgi:tetratricopeptide (TPR) repeat protein
MRHILKTASWLIVLTVSLVPPVSSQDLRDPGFMAEVQTGFGQIFNLDYDEAMVTFSRLRSQNPQHPAPAFYMAVVLWLRELFEREDLDLTKFLAPTYFDRPTKRLMPEEDRQNFMDLIAESRKLAERVLIENPDDKDARYFVASTYGMLAAFAITVDHSRGRALDYGKKSYKLHSQLVSTDRHYYDSYMTLGVYEYIVGNLPWYIKWLAWIAGYHGSEKRGSEYLRLAAERGLFVGDEARVMLIVLYVREKRYATALAEQEHLQAKYTRSFIFPLTRAQILEKMGAVDLAVAEYQSVLSKSDAGVPNYHRLKLATARYMFARKFMDLERADLALWQFLGSIEDVRTPPRERILSHLGAGQALDLLGRRAEAITKYQFVLELVDTEGSHRRAKAFIKQPYRSPSREKKIEVPQTIFLPQLK